MFDLLNGPDVAAEMTRLGYPTYLPPFLGFWKLLGVAALLAPGLPRVKEWAYAGIFFDLAGATYSHAASHDAVADTMVPVVLIGLLVASWWLRPASRVLAGPLSAPAASRARAEGEAPLAA